MNADEHRKALVDLADRYDKASELLAERALLMRIKWFDISIRSDKGKGIEQPLDDELALAVEAFRERLIAEVDGKIHALGRLPCLEVQQEPTSASPPVDDHRDLER